MAKQGSRIGDELLEELLGGEDPVEAFRNGDLLTELRKAVAERALEAEMQAHLEGERDSGTGNHRNGHNRKRVLTGGGAMEVAVPRDRAGRFEPRLIEKYCRRLPGFDDKVISMYARGMTTREIRSHVEELYGLSVSAELISKVTDAVHDEIRQWQSRPLEETCAIVYFDAVRVKIRDEGLVRNKAVYPAIVRSWRARREEIIPFLAFSAPVRRAIYTTNAIESLNSTVRRAVRTRGHFPNDRAAAKLIYLALRNVAAKWRKPPPYRHEARIEFSIRFGERFRMLAE